jgi:hypothetical protein
VAKVAVDIFSKLSKKGGKGGKSGRRHFLPAVQKKVVKVAKPALPLLPPFFRQVLKNVSIYTLDMRLILTSLHSSCHSAHRN